MITSETFVTYRETRNKKKNLTKKPITQRQLLYIVKIIFKIPFHALILQRVPVSKLLRLLRILMTYVTPHHC